MRTKSQLGWLNLPHSPILPPPVTAKQRVILIPGDQPEEEVDGYAETDFNHMLRNKVRDSSVVKIEQNQTASTQKGPYTHSLRTLYLATR